MEIIEELDSAWRFLWRDGWGKLYLSIDMPVYNKAWGGMVQWTGNRFDFTCYNHLFTEVRGDVYLCIDTYRKGRSEEFYLKKIKVSHRI